MQAEYPEVAAVALVIGAAHGFVTIDAGMARELERQLGLPVGALDKARPSGLADFLPPNV